MAGCGDETKYVVMRGGEMKHKDEHGKMVRRMVRKGEIKGKGKRKEGGKQIRDRGRKRKVKRRSRGEKGGRGSKSTCAGAGKGNQGRKEEKRDRKSVV